MAHEINARDYQIGLKQAWHKLTRIPRADGTLGGVGEIVENPGKITREIAFPEIDNEPLFFGDLAGINLAEFKKKHPKIFSEFGFDNIKGKLIDGQRLGDYRTQIALDDGLPVGVPFGESYTAFTPRAAWDWTMERLAGTSFQVTSACMLRNRSRWAISAELSELQKLQKPGTFYTLNVVGSLDMTLSPEWLLSHTTIVCMNTFRMALDSGSSLMKNKCKLTKNFDKKLDNKKGEIEKVVGMAGVMNAALESLGNTPAGTDEVREVFAGEIFRNLTDKSEGIKSTRAKNTLLDLETLWNQGGGIDNSGAGTRAGALAAYTQLLTRGMDGLRSSTKNPFDTFQSSEFGVMANRKTEFFETISRADGWQELRESGQKALSVN